MAYYYTRYYSDGEILATAKNPFSFSNSSQQLLNQVFATCDAKEGFRHLKYQLKIFNKTVPTLFKQYTELCEEGGVNFAAFNIDPLFNNCVDGLVVVDMKKLLDKKTQEVYA